MVRINEPEFLQASLVAVTVVSAAFALVSDRLRTAAVFLWFAGMAVGAIFLSMGAEFLALVQWVLSTLTAISFVFYSGLFGEEPKSEKRWGWFGLSVLTGLAFVLVVTSCLKDMPDGAVSLRAVVALDDLGRALLSEDFLSLKALVVLLLMSLVGAGILARPEREE